MTEKSTGTLWTIGHSIRAWDELAAMLHAARIEMLADVRRFAGSRRNRQFSGQVMGAALAESDIAYAPMPELGGRRPARADSPNLAWRNTSFRGYVDYMQTSDYRSAREQLAHWTQEKRVAVMCAEAMWWQCHRSLIADDFKASGWEVIHLLSPGREQQDPYTSAASIVEGRLDYTARLDGAQQPLLFP